MAHYDLYQSLGLSRQSSTPALGRELDGRLAQAPAGDVSTRDQLTVARAILGDDTRRSLYDQRLNDATAPEIDVESLRDLAAMSTGRDGTTNTVATGGGVGTEDQAQRQTGQFVRQAGSRVTAAGHQVQDSFKQSNLLAITITAVVTAVIVGLAGWASGLFGGGEQFKASKSVVNDMLSKEDPDDLREWVRKNSIVQDRDEVLSSLNLEDGQSFNGMDAVFGGSDLKASDTVLTVEQMKLNVMEDSESFYDGIEDGGYTREEVDSLTVVGIADGSDDPRGSALLMKRDGDYQLAAIFTR